MNDSKIGFSKAIITPPIGTRLSGNIYERYNQNVHDNLYARVIVLSKNDMYAMIQLDLIGVDYYFTDMLRESINMAVGIKKENVTISCIHTHSASAGLMDTSKPYSKRLKHSHFNFDNVLVNYYIREITGCVKKCLQDMDCFTLGYIHVPLQNVCTNRDNPSVPIDDDLQILSFKRNDNKMAVIYNYACHPTVLDQHNDQVSADFPGAVAKLLEAQENIELALFYNGACGDVSTRFTRRNGTFDEVKRIGYILGGEILKQIALIDNYSEIEKVKIKDGIVELNVKNMIPIEEAKKIAEETKKEFEKAVENGLSGPELRTIKLKLQGAEKNINMVEECHDLKTLDFKVKVMEIDDIYLIFIPGELFTSLSLKLKNHYKDKKVLVICYSNGYMGYIPDLQEYNGNSYEIQASTLAPGQGEKLIDSIIELLK